MGHLRALARRATGGIGIWWFQGATTSSAPNRNSSGRRRVFRGMELLEAVRSALPPDTTPLMIGAMLLVILALGREADPRRRRS